MPPAYSMSNYRFNDPQTADFKLVDINGKTIYLHRTILSSYPFFKWYFDTLVNGHNEYLLAVGSMMAAEKLCSYMYTRQINFEKDLSASELSNIIYLALFWEFPEDFWKSLLNYIITHLQRILDEDISIADILYTTLSSRSYSEDYECIEINLIEGIHQYLLTYMHKLNSDSLNWIVIQNCFNIFQKIELIIQTSSFNKLYDILNSNESDSLMMDKTLIQRLINKYHYRKSNIFTPEQEDILISCQYITAKYDMENWMERTLLIRSFVPFRAILYIHAGTVYSSDRENYIVQIIAENPLSTSQRFCWDSQHHPIQGVCLENKDSQDRTNRNYNVYFENNVELPSPGTQLYRSYDETEMHIYLKILNHSFRKTYRHYLHWKIKY